MRIQIPFRGKARSGMTLVELLVAVGIGMMVLAAMGTLMVYTTRSFVAMGNYNDLNQASRNALDNMSREIRQATNVSFYNIGSSNLIGFNGNTLRYYWNPNDGTVTEYKTTSSGALTRRVILEQCDYLRFGISQQNPSNNFTFYPTTTPALGKLVDVSWRCSREIRQLKLNTESVQTAKIVLRN